MQQIRERIMGQISDTIKSFLQSVDSSPIRILGDVPNSILDSRDYLGSIRPFVSKVEGSLRKDRPDNQTSFLAVNIYPGRHSYFVLDLNNVDYVYETAHKDMTPISVYVLRLSKRNPTIFRREALDKTLAETLAAMHNGHGQDTLPLIDDHNRVVQYRNPRSLQP
ncbi:hypothetical protein PDIG_38410 [Penicillium digitatum PHI26]|nr:hypothetical protein PDIP_85040 [Penicillium digitatum Pd1]EKV05142.1 hypothetical protein PDIP_85040 [Penicillium digitatum Pd1]EKV13459.1 hypothetical protein PDIG_38410 [Penicillium digitatum PHI26]